jgi:hypothetical protein
MSDKAQSVKYARVFGAFSNTGAYLRSRMRTRCQRRGWGLGGRPPVATRSVPLSQKFLTVKGLTLRVRVRSSRHFRNRSGWRRCCYGVGGWVGTHDPFPRALRSDFVFTEGAGASDRRCERGIDGEKCALSFDQARWLAVWVSIAISPRIGFHVRMCRPHALSRPLWTGPCRCPRVLPFRMARRYRLKMAKQRSTWNRIPLDMQHWDAPT